MFCVYSTFANFASSYSITSKIATIKQTNLWEWLFVGVVIMTKKYHWYGTNERLGAVTVSSNGHYCGHFTRVKVVQFLD